MNRKIITLPVLLLGLTLLSACQQKNQESKVAPATPEPQQAQQPHVMQDTTAGRLYGSVVETIEASGYVYVQINTGSKKVWAAGPPTPIKKGDMIAITTDMPMKGFHSKALNRNFDMLYFVDRFITDTPAGEQSAVDPHGNIMQSQPAVQVSGIKKAEGGKTIEEIFQHKQDIANQSVGVRGKVVKFTPKVMGKNWLHVQDGSTDKALVITTDNTAKPGDIVLASGNLALNKDFGYGYVYDVLIEDAKITVE